MLYTFPRPSESTGHFPERFQKKVTRFFFYANERTYQVAAGAGPPSRYILCDTACAALLAYFLDVVGTSPFPFHRHLARLCRLAAAAAHLAAAMRGAERGQRGDYPAARATI